MARDPQKFKLGLFTIGGIVIGTALTIAFGAGKWFRETVPIYCYFDENVSGLEPGSAIKYRGVTIGDVAEVRLLPPRERVGGMRPGSTIEVRCNLVPESMGAEGARFHDHDVLQAFVDENVRAGLRVSIAWKDITGQKYLSFDYQDPEQSPIPSLNVDPQQPYVPTAVGATLEDIQRDLAATLAQLARVDFVGISDRVVTLLDTTNKRIDELDTKAMSEHAEATLSAIRELVEDPGLERAIARLDGITGNLDVATTRARELLEMGELDATIKSMASASASVENLTALLEAELPGLIDQMSVTASGVDEAVRKSDFPRTASAVREAADGIGGASRSVSALREDLRSVLTELRSAGRAFKRLAALLEERPRALLSGRAESNEE